MKIVNLRKVKGQLAAHVEMLDEHDGLVPVGIYAALIVNRLAPLFFPPANDNPPPSSEDTA